MSTRYSRAGTLQKQRLIQIGTAAACVAFVGMALGAVVIDRSVAPAEKPTPPALAPVAGSTDEAPKFQPIPKLIAEGLLKVYELDAIETPAGPVQGDRPVQPPPQEVVLVAAIGQPGSMMAVIREGASQTAMAEGQRAGTVEVLEVRPGWARVKHNGQEKELTVGKSILMVSDMGGGGAAPMSSQIITQPGNEAYMETAEEGGITRTGGPTTFSRATSGGANPRGPGTPGGRRGGGNSGAGNQGNGTNGVGGGGGNQANGNGVPASRSEQKRQEEDR